ncbi:MAG TPA: J domain-containing protein [Ktedonobacteraceae bacterium]|nr:J domain-containing protein [Ktedonobacteraceae bacterium]
MGTRPPPKQHSIPSLLWEIIRLSARMVWGSRANPVRPVLERQQALAVLGLPPTATPQQIKRRYRELAKKHHPDRGGNSREMQRVIAAYQFLIKESS